MTQMFATAGADWGFSRGTLGRFVATSLRAIVGLWLAALWLPGPAGANPVATEHVSARLLSRTLSVAPGQDAALVLVLDIIPHWHTYWRNPGDSGEAPRVDWRLPDGVGAGPLGFTMPARIRVGPLVNFGYSGRALHPVSLSIPPDWPVGTPVPIQAEVHWLVCAEHCIPESVTLSLELATSAEPGAPDPAAAPLFAAADAGLPEDRIRGRLSLDRDGGARLFVPVDPVLGRNRGESLRSVWFYPDQWGLIDHAAEQPWRIEAERLSLDLVPGAAVSASAAEGLLVVEDGSGRRRSFSILAERVETAGSAGADRDLGLLTALAFAFLGGLILNLMPCVFPVLAIKVAGLAGQSGLAARERARHGLAYTAGVLLFFALLAGALMLLRAGGQAVGWGFQLQYPPFVAAMAYLFLVLGLSLAGAVTLGGRLMGLAAGAGGGTGGRVAGHFAGRSGVGGAFATGAVAALVAAPCTAPFMGAALGYAMTLHWAPALLVMSTLGLGLAAPFLLLCLWPGLARRLPRPGPWMETMKQALAFPMLATAAWLLWVIGVQAGPDGLALVLAGALTLSLGLWVRERTAMAAGRWPAFGAASALAAFLVAIWLAAETRPVSLAPSDAGERQASEPYSAERLAEARAEGRRVFVNMTAAWCITCLANERVALSSTAVRNAFGERDVLYLKGDWTNREPRITDYLAGFGRNGVPIYVYYAPGQPPAVLPQLLTPSIVLDAIGAAGGDGATRSD